MATLKKFKNLEEIKQYLNKETQGALEDTLKVMRAKLKSFIIQDVYNAYDPIFYKRTRWLLRIGVLDYYISHMFGKVYGGIRINSKGYPVNIEKYQHGNYIFGAFDSEDFIQMLNGEIESGIWNPFNFPSLARQPFWDDFIEWAKNDKDGYAVIFKEKCKKRGIDLENLGSSDNNNAETKPKSKIVASEPPATSVTGTSNDIGRKTISQQSGEKHKDLFKNLFGVHKYTNSNTNNSALGNALNTGQYDALDSLNDLFGLN